MIESLKEEADGVTVNFTNGKIDTQKYDLVIAADGMGSKTRSMIFEEKSYQSTECVKSLGWYIAYFTIPRLEDDLDADYWRWFHAPGGLCVHVRPHRNKKTVGVYLSVSYDKKGPKRTTLTDVYHYLDRKSREATISRV